MGYLFYLFIFLIQSVLLKISGSGFFIVTYGLWEIGNDNYKIYYTSKFILKNRGSIYVRELN